MPRFAITKYTPVKDSSEGLRSLDPARLVLAIHERKPPGEGLLRFGCPCGCGEQPEGTKAIFRMGHDARFRGKLTRAHLTGTEVIFVVGGIGGQPTPALSAMSIATRYGWQEYLRHADMAREGKNRQVVQRALHSARLVKVGRWEYTGQVVAIYDTPGGEQYEIEYVTRMGDVKRTRVPASEAPVASGEES